MIPDGIQFDLNLLARFLARRDIAALNLAALGSPSDVLVLIGSSLLITTEIAAKAMRWGVAKRLLISGGIGHSTEDLCSAVRKSDDLHDVRVDDRAEAEIFADVLVNLHALDRSGILVETKLTNCGANASESKRLLEAHGITPASLIIVQDPTMQRRTHASFERVWQGQPAPRIMSFAPFVPHVADGEIDPPGQWPLERFVSLVLGEIPRLFDGPDGYGPKGRDFIVRVEVPDEVLQAHRRVSEWAGKTTRQSK